MREIKFRCYGGAPTKIFYPREILFIKNEKYIVWDNEGIKYCPTVPLMQYTGLKDKNGVEIYEGDIIANSSLRECKVGWNKYQGCWDAEPLNNLGNPLGFGCHQWSMCIKVIGNIYENPELIKGDG